jgi:hypothetical protein
MARLKNITMEAKKELTWEEFKERYSPVKQTERKGINRYLLDVYSVVEINIKDTVIRKERVNRENYNKAIYTYSMYVWTLVDDNTIVSGKRFDKAIGYIICEIPHYMEELIKVNLKEENHERVS